MMSLYNNIRVLDLTEQKSVKVNIVYVYGGEVTYNELNIAVKLSFSVLEWEWEEGLI